MTVALSCGTLDSRVSVADMPRDEAKHETDSPTYTVPIQRVQTFTALAENQGWDVRAAMFGAGISPSLLARGRSRVTPAQASALLGWLHRETHDELLGLGLAPVPQGTFRLVGYALLGAATDLGRMLSLFEELQPAAPGIPPIRLRSDATIATLSVDISTIHHPLDLAVDTMLTSIHRALGWVIGSRIRLHRVDVPHRRRAQVDDYDVLFGAPIRFSSPMPALLFDTSVLGAPIMRNHKEYDEFLNHGLATIAARRDYGVSVADKVRRIMEEGLAGNWPSAHQVAARLAMSPQTLRRKLGQESTSWSQIRDDLLRDAAIASLAAGTESVAQLSDRLGFSERRAFLRAFRRWTGSTPGAYRPRRG